MIYFVVLYSICWSIRYSSGLHLLYLFHYYLVILRCMEYVLLFFWVNTYSVHRPEKKMLKHNIRILAGEKYQFIKAKYYWIGKNQMKNSERRTKLCHIDRWNIAIELFISIFKVIVIWLCYVDKESKFFLGRSRPSWWLFFAFFTYFHYYF